MMFEQKSHKLLKLLILAKNFKTEVI